MLTNPPGSDTHPPGYPCSSNSLLDGTADLVRSFTTREYEHVPVTPVDGSPVTTELAGRVRVDDGFPERLGRRVAVRYTYHPGSGTSIP